VRAGAWWPIFRARLTGPQRLAAFHELPDAMRAGAWLALRREVERRRELEGEG